MPALKFNSDGSRHIHTYVRKGKGRSARQYMCANPHCIHYVNRELLRGKESVCSVCHKTVILLTPDQLQLAKPRCIMCADTAKAREIREKLETLKELGIA